MNTRIFTVVASVTLLCLTTGCGVVRNFWFGHGARCGVNAQPPNYLQPGPAAPDCQCAPAPAPYANEAACGIESYGGVINDPYLSGEVVGDGVIMEGEVMGDNFSPRIPQSYGANKFDTDGARIINELPPGV